MTYLKASRILFLALTFSVIFFIFFNSAQTSDASSLRSKALLRSVLDMIDRVKPPARTVSIKMPVLEDPMIGKRLLPERSLPEPGDGKPDVKTDPAGADAGKPDVKTDPADADAGKPDVKTDPADTDVGKPDVKTEPRSQDTHRIYLGRFTRVQFMSAVHKVLRKTAHFFEYSLLAMAISLFLSTYYQRAGSLLFRCLALGFLCACLDETIQHWTPGRAASVRDVLLDVLGVAVGFLLIFRAVARRRNRNGSAGPPIG